MATDTVNYGLLFQRNRLPRLCVPVAASTAAEMAQKAESLVRDNYFIELRLDYIPNPLTALPALKKFFSFHSGVTVIATCRRAVNGGKFRGSVASQVSLLSKAAAAGCQLVDLELETAEALKPAEYQRLRSHAAIVLSFHDFKGTRKLDETFAKMLAHPADIYKLATTAKCLHDNVVMMRFLEKQSDRYPVVGMCMGEQGLISRILGIRFGSAFTFVAAEAGEETAPGQITIRELRDVYRVEGLDAATGVYGVAGDPVSHSLSPVMLNTAFRRENVNAVYLPLHTKELDDLLETVGDLPVQGLSVTMPYKEEIAKHLDNSDVITQKSQACNTVVRMPNGNLYGFNTDVAGVIGPLEQRVNLNGAKVLVLGAGGAARSAVFGLKERGTEVYILNRTPAAGQKLARQAHAKNIKRTDLKKLEFDVIINATPVGMTNGMASPLEASEIKCRYVLDMVYHVPETRFMKLAKANGAEVIPGAEMFVHQGARQFEIWTGKPAPLTDMYKAVVMAQQAQAEEAGRTSKNHIRTR